MARLTEQKLKNKKFYRTETSIFIALASAKELLSPTRLVRLAGISRATLYRHHKTVYEIIPDYEEYILKKYRLLIKRLTKIKNTRLKSLYEHTLLFMIIYQKIIRFLIERGNRNLIEAMLQVLQPKILPISNIHSAESFNIYIKEISTVIEQWALDGFNKDRIPATLGKIMYLTETASSRLAPLARYDLPEPNSTSSSSSSLQPTPSSSPQK